MSQSSCHCPCTASSRDEHVESLAVRGGDDHALQARRGTLKAIAGVALCAGGLGGAHAADGPVAGDALVLIDGDNKPLTAADIQAGAKQVFAWPYDTKAGKPRDGSRLNKVLLLRVEPTDLDPATAALAADGVVAYSGVCTHQGCDVNAWRAAEKTLLCFCHFSQFHPAQGGSVVAGPAPRPLPGLPLKLDAGRLVVAGPFTSTPGGAQA
jgi:Rieske Fe-S protein